MNEGNSDPSLTSLSPYLPSGSCVQLTAQVSTLRRLITKRSRPVRKPALALPKSEEAFLLGAYQTSSLHGCCTEEICLSVNADTRRLIGI
jgi:hypothetical protein